MSPFAGPYEVLDVDNEYHDVKLRVPAPRPGKNFMNKWIHVSNVKPVVYTKDGKLL